MIRLIYFEIINVLNSNNNNNIEGSIYHRTNIFKNISTFNPNLIMNKIF